MELCHAHVDGVERMQEFCAEWVIKAKTICLHSRARWVMQVRRINMDRHIEISLQQFGIHSKMGFDLSGDASGVAIIYK